MIDLTPLDVRNKRGDFRKGLRGYEPSEVDAFLEVAAERLEAVVRENLAMKERLAELETRLERAESRETAVQEALVSAQSLREQVREQTQRESELRMREAEQVASERIESAKRDAARILGETEREADRIRTEAASALDRARRDLEELRRSRARFLRTYRSLLEKELDLVLAEEDGEGEPQVDLDELRIFHRGDGASSAAADDDTSPDRIPTGGALEGNAPAAEAETP
jgi:cell division initiation protein